MIDTVVKIKGSTVTITGNPTLERNVKEELDTGKIVIESTREKRYEMYDKVDITTPYNTTEQYLIQADNPIQLNATEYQHNLTLFENIAYLNTIYPADRSFKVIGQTLEDILTTYKRELEAYHNIIITWTTIPQAVLDEIIPFKEFAGINLSTILLSLFRKIWAVPKVNRIGANWDIYPLYHNEKNNSIDKESISKMSQQNNVDYATQVKSQLKNAVNERTVDEVSWFPSASGYVLPRSSAIEKNNSKLRYELDSNIIKILGAEAVDIEFSIWNNTTSAVEYPTGTFDIASLIIQDEAWDLLNITTETDGIKIQLTDNAKNHVRFKVAQPYINKLWEAGSDGIIFQHDTTYLINAIERAILVEYNITGDYKDVLVTSATTTESIKMRFKYVKQRNIDLIHVRKTKGNMNTTTTIHQQRDASVEVNEYKKNLKLYANRMGNNENSKTKLFVYPDEPFGQFDYTDEKTIVTRVQNTYHNKFVHCEYEESENFGNIEAEYALMRRSDPYTISSKSVTTNLVIQELIEISEVSRALDTRFTSDARRLLNGLFEATTIPFSKVAVGVFKPVLTSWNSSHAIHMPVEPSGDGDLITIHVQFPHQTIAGKTYYDLATGTYKNYLNPLPYTDTEGTLTNYELYFTPDILFEDAGQYPLILDETLYLADEYTVDSIIEPIDLDTSASLAVTLQVSYVADEHIYIGNAMTSSNYFVREQATTTAIKIYTSAKPYGQYDQAPRSYDVDSTATISYVYSFANRTITITPTSEMNYFSIVKDGAILIAVNKLITAGQVYVLSINHLSDTVEIASAEINGLVTVSASMNVILKLSQMVATEGITSVTASIDTYQKVAQAASIDGVVSIIAEVSYYQEVNQAIDVEGIVTTTAVLSYYTQRDIEKEVDATVVTTATLDYYTVRDIEYNTEAITVVTANMNYYRRGDLAKAFDATTTVTAVINYTASLNPEPVEWVEIGAGTPTGGNCITLSDEGNIKEEDTSYCSFVNDGASYESTTDDSTTKPACQNGAAYTLCVLFDGEWWCQDYIGQETAQTTLYECQLK